MSTYAWTAAAGGDWNAAGDWVPAGVPGAADTADFATGGNSYAVTGDAQAAAIDVDADQVTFEGFITSGVAGGPAGLAAMDGGGVTIDQPAFLTTSGLEFSAGTSLTVEGLLVDTGGGSVDAALITGPNAYFTAAQAVTFNQLTVTSGATFASDLSLADGGSLTLDTSAIFGGNTLTLAGSGTVHLAQAYGATGATLSETIVVGVGALTFDADPGVLLSVAGPISGAGTVAISGGTVALSGTNTYTGGTMVQDAALTLTGPQAAGTGPVLLDGAMLTVQSDPTGAPTNTIVGTGGADTVNAAAGDQLVFAGQASTFLYTGGTGASTVVGGAGVLNATGGSGGDMIFGGTSGVDHLTAGSGATTLAGGGGTLTAVGIAGDLLVAAAGNTTLNGADSDGNNIFFAEGAGNTVVEAGGGTSTIVSSGAHVSIYGAVGTENVFLSGGSAQLSFVDGFNGGTMNVIGFTNQDFLHVNDYPGDEVQAALNSAVVYGDNTVVTLTDDTRIVLYGFTGLSAANFDMPHMFMRPGG